jgi:hypothetical protein
MTPALKGLPTLFSASTAWARPWSRGRRFQNRGSSQNVRTTVAALAKPVRKR